MNRCACSELIKTSGLLEDSVIYENLLGFQTIIGNGAHLDSIRGHASGSLKALSVIGGAFCISPGFHPFP
jgi:hypothetical protein